MKKLFTAVNLLVVVLLLLVVAGCVYRWLLIWPYPIGTGDEGKSPDGRLMASVTRYYDETFWGSSKSWVEFEIRRTGDDALVRRLVTDPIPNAVFGSRSDTDVVFWTPDSKEVDFVFPGVRIKLESDLKNKL